LPWRFSSIRPGDVEKEVVSRAPPFSRVMMASTHLWSCRSVRALHEERAQSESSQSIVSSDPTQPVVMICHAFIFDTAAAAPEYSIAYSRPKPPRSASLRSTEKIGSLPRPLLNTTHSCHDLLTKYSESSAITLAYLHRRLEFALL